MFEMLLKPKTLLRRPYLMGLFALFAVSVAVILSLKIFPESSSFLVVVFTIIPVIPVMVKLIEHEEYILEHSRHLLRAHPIITIYAWYFLGVVVAFAAWFLLLPAATGQTVFSEQTGAIYDFRGPSGFALLEHGDPVNPVSTIECDPVIVERMSRHGVDRCEAVDFNKDHIEEFLFYKDGQREFILELKEYQQDRENYRPIPYRAFLLRHILFNNLQIFLFVMLTSFIFGAGALFVITWNASIVGVFMADMFTQGMSKLSLAGFLVHGVPEFVSFFVAALAGGILSVVFLRHKPSDPQFKRIVLDFGILCAFSVLLLFIAAFLEVYL
ncbi:MAG: stage II sporulation protein M [Nanoarchaeota archaeon]